MALQFYFGFPADLGQCGGGRVAQWFRRMGFQYITGLGRGHFGPVFATLHEPIVQVVPVALIRQSVFDFIPLHGLFG